MHAFLGKWGRAENFSCICSSQLPLVQINCYAKLVHFRVAYSAIIHYLNNKKQLFESHRMAPIIQVKQSVRMNRLWWPSVSSNGNHGQSPQDSGIGQLISEVIFFLSVGQHGALFLAILLRLHGMGQGQVVSENKYEVLVLPRKQGEQKQVFQTTEPFVSSLQGAHSQVCMNLCCPAHSAAAVRKKPWTDSHSPDGFPEQAPVAEDCGSLLPSCSSCSLSYQGGLGHLEEREEGVHTGQEAVIPLRTLYIIRAK